MNNPETKQAAERLSTWLPPREQCANDSTGAWSWTILDALADRDSRLAARPYGCKCTTMAAKALGDGCDECNKALTIELLTERAEEAEKQLAAAQRSAEEAQSKGAADAARLKFLESIVRRLSPNCDRDTDGWYQVTLKDGTGYYGPQNLMTFTEAIDAAMSATAPSRSADGGDK